MLFVRLINVLVDVVQAAGSLPESTRIFRRRDSGNLTVVNLRPEDHGVYECVAASVVSSVITTTLLIIERMCLLQLIRRPYTCTLYAQQGSRIGLRYAKIEYVSVRTHLSTNRIRVYVSIHPDNYVRLVVYSNAGLFKYVRK